MNMDPVQTCQKPRVKLRASSSSEEVQEREEGPVVLPVGSTGPLGHPANDEVEEGENNTECFKIPPRCGGIAAWVFFGYVHRIPPHLSGVRMVLSEDDLEASWEL